MHGCIRKQVCLKYINNVPYFSDTYVLVLTKRGGWKTFHRRKYKYSDNNSVYESFDIEQVKKFAKEILNVKTLKYTTDCFKSCQDL